MIAKQALLQEFIDEADRLYPEVTVHTLTWGEIDLERPDEVAPENP
ncbi:hypothetical protein [Minwuia sp.]